MRCPDCDTRTRVVHTQHRDDGTHRWRCCPSCDQRFRTLQSPETVYIAEPPEVSPNAVFTTDDIRMIRNLAEIGTAKRDLSKQFGVAVSTINSIIKRHTYTNV